MVDAHGRTLGSSAHGLLELALAAGGKDNISIEMARLVAPPKVAASPAPGPAPISHHTVLWVVLSVFMLAFLAFCVMAYFALWHD
jgi:hypothetical protein